MRGISRPPEVLVDEMAEFPEADPQALRQLDDRVQNNACLTILDASDGFFLQPDPLRQLGLGQVFVFPAQPHGPTERNLAVLEVELD
jgi:hypothetical protein